MNQIIPKNFYVKTIGGCVKRIKNERGEYLYDYLDLCNEILVPDRTRNNLFYELSEYEREEITIDVRPVKFVTAEGFKIVLNKHMTVLYEKGMNIYDDLTTSELKEDIELINKITQVTDIDNNTATEIIDGIYNIYHSKDYKEQLWKLHPEIDPAKDMLSEKIHFDILHDDIDYDEYTIMKKKSGTDEERIEKYKRHKGQGTSCPAWLIDIIK